MKGNPLRIFARLWLLLLMTGGIWGALDGPAIEAHQLHRVLKPGFDAFGRFCPALVAVATARTAAIVLPVGVFSLACALLLSSIALLRSGRIEFLLRAFLDTLSALPGFLLALALGVFFSPSFGTLALGALFLTVPNLSRYFESQLNRLQHEPFVVASKALGAPPLHLWIWHYQPELLRMLRAILPFLLTRLILIETSLHFLGLGPAPERETWGRLLYQGKDYLIEAPWILYTAALPLGLTLLSFHLLSREEPQ
jgi:peptide/nickel transport system permease protein